MGDEISSLLDFVLDLLRRLRPRRLLPGAVDQARGQGDRPDAEGTRRPKPCGSRRPARISSWSWTRAAGALRPKISVQARDAIGRSWQMSTIQVDLMLPQRFDLSATSGPDGDKHRPVMIHRALFRIRRAVLRRAVEHYAGRSTWLAPVQAKCRPSRTPTPLHAAEVAAELQGHGFRSRSSPRTRRSATDPPGQGRQGPVRCVVVGDDDVAHRTVGSTRGARRRAGRGRA